MKSRYQTARKWLIFWTLFIGIGAMIDFGPLLSGPSLFLFGAGAQFGIFAAILVAALLGFRIIQCIIWISSLSRKRFRLSLKPTRTRKSHSSTVSISSNMPADL